MSLAWAARDLASQRGAGCSRRSRRILARSACLASPPPALAPATLFAFPSMPSSLPLAAPSAFPQFLPCAMPSSVLLPCSRPRAVQARPAACPIVPEPAQHGKSPSNAQLALAYSPKNLSVLPAKRRRPSDRFILRAAPGKAGGLQPR